MAAKRKKATAAPKETEEQRKLRKVYMQDYPHLEPCKRCRWWREMGNGAYYKGNTNARYVDIKYRQNFACHYTLITGIIRADKEALYTEHKCKYFEEVNRKK